jgi:hypothetical protein
MYIIRFHPYCSFLTKILSVSLFAFLYVFCVQYFKIYLHLDTYVPFLFTLVSLSLSCFLLYHLLLLCKAFIFISLSVSHPFIPLYVNLLFLFAIFLCLPIILFSDVFPSVILSLSRSIFFYLYHFFVLFAYWLPVLLLKTTNSMAAR